MLISAVRYTRGLDLEARVYAETTGIAMGWLASGEVFRCGCWVCEFVVERRLHASREHTEREVNERFFALVTKHSCLHWPKYLRYKEGFNEEVQLARQTLKRSDEKNARLARAAELVEPPPWELEPEADQLEDQGADVLDETFFDNED